jgi:hypothetical protein
MREFVKSFAMTGFNRWLCFVFVPDSLPISWLISKAPDQLALRHSSQLASCGQFEMDLRSEQSGLFYCPRQLLISYAVTIACKVLYCPERQLFANVHHI